MRFQFGDNLLDVDRRLLVGARGAVHLEPQVFAVLTHLIEHRHRVVSRAELTTEVWGTQFISDAAVNSRIKAARQAIGDTGRRQQWIRTHHGVGYQFVGSVEADLLEPPVPRVQYVTTDDGVSLAYQAFGEGERTLLWVTGSASHLQVFWKIPVIEHALRRLGRRYKVITLDKRGCGLSDRDLDGGSLERRADDLRCVLDANDVESAILLACSEAGATGMQMAVRHPDRVELLVLASTFAVSSASEWSDDEFAAIEAAWGTGELLREWWCRGVPDDVMAKFGEYEMLMATPRHFVKMLRESAEIDARDLAPQIRVPTAVVHSLSDPVVPFSDGQWLAANISDAELTTFEAPFHGPGVIADIDLYFDVIDRAIMSRVENPFPAASM